MICGENFRRIMMRKQKDLARKRKQRWRSVPWKPRNLRKISNNVLLQLDQIGSDDIIVASVTQIPESAIRKGHFQHVGISMVDGILHIEHDVLIPLSSMGKYSAWNRHGYTIVWKNRPKVSKTYSWEVPNYGDWSKGSHSIDMSREVYQRNFVAPKLHPIKIELLGEEIKDERYYVCKFVVDEVLSKQQTDFQDKLLFNLNLLQENTGHCGVFASDASTDEYLHTLYVDWEILPPGEREQNINRILNNPTEDETRKNQRFIERYDFLVSLNPQNLIKGTNGFRRYFGALFADDLVVFENIEYGNAIYVMFKDWQSLSKLSRTELLSGSNFDIVRIPHMRGRWKKQVRDIIHEKLEKNNGQILF
jgi:hypothetical protein